MMASEGTSSGGDLDAGASARPVSDGDGNAPVSRMVFCRRHRRELPGLDAPPLPGPSGQDIFENVSAQAWREWQQLQTMLINEHHLALVDRQARAYLSEQMRRFLAGEEHDQPSGYVPPPGVPAAD